MTLVEIQPLKKAQWICHGCEPDALAVELLTEGPALHCGKSAVRILREDFLIPLFLTQAFFFSDPL